MDREDGWLVGWATGYAAVGAGSLAIPLYALSLGGGPLLVGLLASTAAFAGVPGALLWGELAARTRRRRPFVLVALAATALVLAAVPFVRTPLPLLVANAALWFVVSAAAPVLNLVMVEGVPPAGWEDRIGELNAAQGYGWVAGLVVGSLWATALPAAVPGVGEVTLQRYLFVVLAALAAVGTVVVRVRYPEPSTVPAARFRHRYRRLSREGWGAGRVLRAAPYGPSRLYWALVTIRPDRLNHLRSPLWRYLAAVGCFSVGFAAFWGPMPAYLTAAGYDAGTVFLLFLVANLGSAVCYTRVGLLTRRTGAATAQAGALVARVVLFPAVAVLGATAVGRVAVAVCFALVGVTWAVIAVTTTGLVTHLADASARGEALGLGTAIAGVGTGAGSVLGGAIAASGDYLVAFVAAGAVVLAGAALVVVADRWGVPGATAAPP